MDAASTFRFMYESELTPMLYQIRSIGMESVSTSDYRWDGLKRNRGGIIFQYTLRGEGRISLRGEQEIAVGKHRAFLVPVPNDHCYYYDLNLSKGEPWEFIWIRLEHPEMMAVAHSLTERLGAVFEMKPDAEPILIVQELYKEVAEGKWNNDPYQISIRAYEWIVSMLRFASGHSAKQDLPDAFRAALAYIDRHFADPIGLEEMAEAAKLSKHHFCQAFTKRLGYSPREYLLRRRTEQAALLLKRSALSVQTIALQSGFSDAGYFSKVFRKRMGVSPLEYRFAAGELKEEQVRFVD
jgi:AraC-like DNA-binding protein